MTSYLNSARAGRIFALAIAVAFAAPPEALPQDFSAPSVVRAGDEATLSSIISSRVAALPFDEGDSFTAGDVLVELDCGIYRSEAEAALAESDGFRAAAASRQALFSRGGTGRLEVDIAEAEAAAAAARAISAKLHVEACEIRAPYDGRVSEHAVNAFEYVEAGQPVISIVGSKTLDLEIIAPAEWLLWMKSGTKGNLHLEASRESYPVMLETLGPVVDPVSRTIELRAVFDAEVTGVLPGMSGQVTLEPAQ